MINKYGKMAFVIGFGFTFGKYLAKGCLNVINRAVEGFVEIMEKDIAKTPEAAKIYETMTKRTLTNNTTDISFGFQPREEL